jgi:hypothetical protein
MDDQQQELAIVAQLQASVVNGVPFPLNNQNVLRVGKVFIRTENLSSFHLDLSGLTEDADCDLLLKQIENSPQLRMVWFHGGEGNPEGVVVPACVVDPFVSAISRNPQVVALTLRDVNVSNALSCSSISCLDLRNVALSPLFLASIGRNMRSLKYIVMKTVSFNATNISNNETAQIAVAFQDNSSVEHFIIDDLSSSVCIPILQGLLWNQNLKTLQICGTALQGYSRLLQAFLASQNALQRLTLSGRRGELLRIDYQGFCPISQGMQSRRICTELALRYCRFDEESTRLFLQETDFSQHSLYLDDSVCFETSVGTSGRAALWTNMLQQPNPSFRKLVLDSSFLLNRQFITALERNTCLEDLSLLGLLDAEMCQTLVRCLPHVRHLKKIKFVLDVFLEPSFKEELLHALQGNLSLEEVSVRKFGSDASFFDSEDSATLKSLCERNRKIRYLQTVVFPKCISTDDMTLRFLCESADSFERFAKKD